MTDLFKKSWSYINRYHLSRKKMWQVSTLVALSAILVFIPSHQAFAGWLSDFASSAFFSAMIALLSVVFGVVIIFLTIAITILDWAINPVNFTAVVNSDAILLGWKYVRDIMNMAFILVLLYSAFCTVFQVEKYSYKKILLTLVIMALLVNFSFPIARFIIDTGNVMAYSILGKVFPGMTHESTGVFSFGKDIVESMGIVKMVSPSFLDSIFKSNRELAIHLLLAIIFLFILSATILTIAILFVIRIVVLAVLIIFAPIGFVGAIFPGTQKYADDWWTNLFKQSFFAPIMIFMLDLAFYTMKVINDKDCLGITFQKAFEQKQNIGMFSNATQYSQTIATGAVMAIPIVILWTGMIVAKKMGGDAAELVVGKGMKMMSGAMTKPGKWAVGSLWSASRIPGTFKKFSGNFKKTGKLFGRDTYMGSERREAAEERTAGYLSGGEEGRDKAAREQERKKVQEAREERKKSGIYDDKEMTAAMNDEKATPETRIAAALDKLEKGSLGTGEDVRDASYKHILDAIEKSSHNKDYYQSHIDKKMKEENLDVLINRDFHKLIGQLDRDDITDKKTLLSSDVPEVQVRVTKVFDDNIKGMGPEQFGKQNDLLGRKETMDYLENKEVEATNAQGEKVMVKKYDPEFFQKTAEKMKNTEDRTKWKAREFINADGKAKNTVGNKEIVDALKDVKGSIDKSNQSQNNQRRGPYRRNRRDNRRYERDNRRKQNEHPPDSDPNFKPPPF